jgi:Transposase IS200 like.
MNELPKRKHPRLKGYDYAKNGAYFITICVKGRHNMLGELVGRDAHIAPSNHIMPTIRLSEYGKIIDKYINSINSPKKSVAVDKYVIMPNHVHMIIILENEAGNPDHREMMGNGATWASRPTAIPDIVRSFKVMVSKEIGFSLWQTSYHDHIIRSEDEYHRICQYIDDNPAKWAEDDYFSHN